MSKRGVVEAVEAGMLQAEVKRLQAENAALVAALREYGRHRSKCNLYVNPLGLYVPPPDAKCDCGLHTTLAAHAARTEGGRA